MIKKILLGIGGTPFTDVAIQRAVELCRIHEGQLTAVTVVDEQRLNRVGPVPAGAGGAAVELREHRIAVTRERIKDAVSALRRACQDADVPVVVHREEGKAFDLMVDYARYHDVSVFGLRSMFEYNLTGPSDVQPADVLSRMVLGGVRPIVAVSERFRPIRRVLIAYGGSVRAAETMKQFIRLNPWPGASVRLLACGSDVPEADAMLRDAAGYCHMHGFEPELRCRMESPSEGILAEATDWDADLIVLGTSRSSAFSRAVFGSTALHVIRHADRPLFLGR